MNCDQAFDCLTDSHRRHSADLERHLAGCPRCRQMQDTLEPALDLLDEVVEEPDLSGFVRDPRPMVSTESRQLAEQTAARLVATGGGGRQRRGNWSGFVRCAAIFLFGAGALLGLGVAQDLFQQSQCTFRNRSVIRWGTDQPEAVVAGCVVCHPRSSEPAAPAAQRGTKGDFMEIGLGVPVRMETFVAVRRQRLMPWKTAVRDPELRTFVCTVLRRLPRSVGAQAISIAPHNLQVAQVPMHVYGAECADAGRRDGTSLRGHDAGLRRERGIVRWS